jgi:hypothetical protein
MKAKFVIDPPIPGSENDQTIKGDPSSGGKNAAVSYAFYAFYCPFENYIVVFCLSGELLLST